MDSKGKNTILVVDDDASMREFLDKTLTKTGYLVHTASDGEEAIEALSRNDCDVMLLDIRLPGMSGGEVLQRARQEWPSVAVIIITAFPSEEAVIDCMSRGAVRFLTKPFKIDEVLRALAGALHDRRKASADGEGLTIEGGLRDWVELTAPSRQEYLERLENFVDALYDTRLSPSDKEDLKIAVSEIASNAMEWGNKRDVNRRIKMSYCLFPDEIVFKVEDEGEGFEPEVVPEPGTDPVPHLLDRLQQGKRVGGYGLYIARKVMDKVIHSEKGNVVILSKSLAGAPPVSGERETVSDE